MLYVAYGSNLNKEQMMFRVPGAKPFGKGYIHNWKLDFHGNDGNAYATISQYTGGKVPVVLWELSDKQELIMDRYEGFPNSYYKKKIAVYVKGKKHFGTVYIMNESRKVARPSRKYVNTIRVGYADFELDMDYFTDALRRNSEDFYLDDVLEVRDFTKFVPSKKSSKKTSGKSKAKKEMRKDMHDYIKSIKKETQKSVEKPFYGQEQEKHIEPLSGSMASYMRTNFPDDPYWSTCYGYEDDDAQTDYDFAYPDFSSSRKRPSLDYYDRRG